MNTGNISHTISCQGRLVYDCGYMTQFVSYIGRSGQDDNFFNKERVFWNEPPSSMHVRTIVSHVWCLPLHFGMNFLHGHHKLEPQDRPSKFETRDDGDICHYHLKPKSNVFQKSSIVIDIMKNAPSNIDFQSALQGNTIYRSPLFPSDKWSP